MWPEAFSALGIAAGKPSEATIESHENLPLWPTAPSRQAVAMWCGRRLPRRAGTRAVCCGDVIICSGAHACCAMHGLFLGVRALRVHLTQQLPSPVICTVGILVQTVCIIGNESNFADGQRAVRFCATNCVHVDDP